MNRFLAVLFIFALVSCTNFKPVVFLEKRPIEKGDVFESPWWLTFKDAELASTVDTAISGNFDILEMYKRFEQAGLMAKKAGSEKFPKFDFNAGVNLTAQDREKTGNATFDSYSFGLSASYEIDLFGKIRSASESGMLTFFSSKENLKAAMISVSAQVAQTWFNIIGITEKIELTRKQIDNNLALFEILKERYKNSSSSVVDVLKQMQNIKSLESFEMSLVLSKQLLINKLNLLVGKKWAKVPTGIQLEELSKINFDHYGLDVLMSRPDVKSAWFSLESSAFDVARARALRFPSLSLSASYMYSSEQIGDIFKNWVFNLGANLLAPIFDANNRKLDEERARKVLEERVVTYEKTVYTAFKELKDAILAENNYFSALELLKNQINILEDTVEKQKIRYLNGEIDFSIFLNDQSTLYSKLRDLSDVKYNLISNRILFYKVIGGDWVDNTLEKKMNEVEYE